MKSNGITYSQLISKNGNIDVEYIYSWLYQHKID